MKPKLSIVVPTVRTENWIPIYQGIHHSMAGLPFEVIFIGPNVNLPNELIQLANIRTVRDFGCPSRAIQLGALIAQGEYFSYVSDDCLFEGPELSNIINYLDSVNDEKKISNWIYTEGPSYLYGQDPRIVEPQNWFRSKYHDDFKPLKGVEEDWLQATFFTMKTSYFLKLGGINCKFETINYNLHDLCFRARRDGATFAFSKNLVLRAGWVPNRTEFDSPIINAIKYNDYPLLKEMYGEKKEMPICIDVHNWKDANPVWERKWKDKMGNKSSL